MSQRRKAVHKTRKTFQSNPHGQKSKTQLWKRTRTSYSYFFKVDDTVYRFPRRAQVQDLCSLHFSSQGREHSFQEGREFRFFFFLQIWLPMEKLSPGPLLAIRRLQPYQGCLFQWCSACGWVECCYEWFSLTQVLFAPFTRSFIGLFLYPR